LLAVSLYVEKLTAYYLQNDGQKIMCESAKQAVGKSWFCLREQTRKPIRFTVSP
ncbi:hypothetical protein MNBD_PLANCTO02-218, partial [hydrothermal vent metagenome]